MTDGSNTIPSPPNRLLVLEDEKPIAQRIVGEAESIGVQCRSALTLEDFARHYKELDPNLIVLDVVIGSGDASQAVEFLAKNRSTAAIFVISGYSTRIAGTIAGMGRDSGLMIADTINKNADGIRRLMASIRSYMVR